MLGADRFCLAVLLGCDTAQMFPQFDPPKLTSGLINLAPTTIRYIWSIVCVGILSERRQAGQKPSSS